MNIYIALFRGINIGGKHIVPMKELKTILEKIGLLNVQTYIQSGNVVFRSNEKNKDELAEMITAAVMKKYGFESKVILLSVKELENTIKNNPFPQAEAEPKTLHVMFLSEVPESPKLDKMEEIKVKSEQFKLIGKMFYLFAPDGVGRSKLAANIERLLGVPTTGRNWRSVTEILALTKTY